MDQFVMFHKGVYSLSKSDQNEGRYGNFKLTLRFFVL